MRKWKYLPEQHKFTSETIPEIEWDATTDKLSETGKKAFIKHLRTSIGKLRVQPGKVGDLTLDSILWQVADDLGISPMKIIHDLYPQIADEYEIVFVPRLVKTKKKQSAATETGKGGGR